MSSSIEDPNPGHDDPEDEEDDFLREIARVEDVAPPARQPLPGQMLGRFRILSELGRGGMGIVYLAHDENLRRAVALKLLPPSLTRQDERNRRFLREARAAASVTHPNLATIYDVGEFEGNVFIAMERVDGRTLRKLLATGRPALDEVLDIAGQILAGLSKAHQAGIVHRDLKPDNIMITDDGVVKLLDFGLAKQHDGVQSPASASSSGTQERHDSVLRDTAEDQLLGTPGYMSPEQVRGGPLDPRSDLFSFGVICYEMLAGKRPFAGQSSADLQSAILRDSPPPLGGSRSDIPEALVQLVERCLEKDPARRYPSSGALSIALAQLDVGAPLTVTPSSTSRVNARVSLPSVGGRPAVERWSAVAKVLAAVLVALLGSLFFRSQRATSGSEPPVGAASFASANRSVAGEAALEAAAEAARAVAARAVPTPVTDLPPPFSKSPEALAEYAGAMQGIRDGNWGYVVSHLERALELDPSFPMAHLRLAAIHCDMAYMRPRTHFALAVAGRARLSDREQALLYAYEPLLGRDPADMAEHIARLQAAVARFPGDAELAGLMAWMERDDAERKVTYGRRAVELDPQFADGWQMMGGGLFMQGKTEEAMAALDRCIALSPASADCSAERAFVHGGEGRCAEMDEDLRRAVASSTDGMWQDHRATALFALGVAPEAVAEAFEHQWPQAGENERKIRELTDRGNLDVATGHFADAESRLLQARSLVASDTDAQTHAEIAGALIALYTETNRAKDASKIAEQYLKRKDVWLRSTISEQQLIGMYWAMLRARSLTPEAFAEKRDAWIRERRSDSKRAKVVASYAAGVETPAEAREALVLFADIPAPRAVLHKDNSMAMFGKLQALAGNTAEAVALLKKAVNSCYALAWPFSHTQASYYLGQALETTGDSAGACSAYERVLARWGKAKPESITARKARARSRSLRCAGATSTPQRAAG